MPVIGFLDAASPESIASNKASFLQGLMETCYVRVGTWLSRIASRIFVTNACLRWRDLVRHRSAQDFSI